MKLLKINTGNFIIKLRFKKLCNRTENSSLMTDSFRSVLENKNKNPELIGIVLCGGESKRMNSDKALLNYENDPQWKIVIELLKPLCKEVVVSINENQWGKWAKNEGYSFVIDDKKYENHGPLSGIFSVVDKFPNRGFMILGTDFPFLKSENLMTLIQGRSSSFDAVCFEKDDFLQPLVSIIEEEAVPKLIEFFHNGNDSLRQFLGEIKTKVIPANGESFLENVNTESAFKALKK